MQIEGYELRSEINRDDQQNDFWASGECDYTETGNQFPGLTLDETIWDDWDY